MAYSLHTQANIKWGHRVFKVNKHTFGKIVMTLKQSKEQTAFLRPHTPQNLHALRKLTSPSSTYCPKWHAAN